jgi:hypothetical protein
MGFNSTLGYPEWYSASDSSWYSLYQQKGYNIDYLVVAGGGGGAGGYVDGPGGVAGGGGGAGGYILVRAGAAGHIVQMVVILVMVLMAMIHQHLVKQL